MSKLILAIVLVATACLPCVCRGQLHASADFIVATRSLGSDNVFQRSIVELTDSMGVGTGVFQVTDESRLGVDLGAVAGGRWVIGYQSESFGVEGAYMATDQWSALATVSDGGALLASPFSAVGTQPNPIIDNNTFASAAYETELESAEINLTYLLCSGPCGNAVCKLGVRAMAIDEQFQYSSTNAVMSNSLISTTKNRLLGPQVAISGDTPVAGGSLVLNFVGFLAYNEIDRTSVFNGATTLTGVGEASLVGEFSIEYLLAVTSNAAVRVGYQFLGANGIGLATNDPMITPDPTGNVLYQIPYIGVVVVR